MYRTSTIFIALASFLSVSFVWADEFTSSNFKVLDPVVSPSAGYGTSSGYQLWGSIGEIAIGTSTANSFEVKSGFLYFTDEVSATPAGAPSPPPAPSLTSASGASSDGIIAKLIARIPIVKIPGVKISVPPCPNPMKGDFNCDGKVNLQDLSTFLYLTAKPIPNVADLNNDQVVDLKDLSGLFSSWTDRVIAFAPDARVQEKQEEARAGTKSFPSRIFQNVASIARSFSSSLEKAPVIGSADQITQGFFRNTTHRVVQMARESTAAIMRFFGNLFAARWF